MKMFKREPRIKDLTIRIDQMDRMGLMDVIGVLQAWHGTYPEHSLGTFDLRHGLQHAIDELSVLIPKVE